MNSGLLTASSGLLIANSGLLTASSGCLTAILGLLTANSGLLTASSGRLPMNYWLFRIGLTLVLSIQVAVNQYLEFCHPGLEMQALWECGPASGGKGDFAMRSSGFQVYAESLAGDSARKQPVHLFNVFNKG